MRELRCGSLVVGNCTADTERTAATLLVVAALKQCCSLNLLLTAASIAVLLMLLLLLLQYDKLVLVASGAGLTPMLSLINRYSETKEVHLLWTTRDRHMIRHFRTMVRARWIVLMK
jgi:Ferric reductase NAD binding domain